MEDQHFVPDRLNHESSGSSKGEPHSVKAFPIRRPFEPPACEPVPFGYDNLPPQAEDSKPAGSNPKRATSDGSGHFSGH